MNDIVRSLYKEENDVWGLPQEYRGVKIYPLKVGDVRYKQLFMQIFGMPKNHIADKNILKMSYLKFLLVVIQASVNYEGTEVSDWIISFLSYVTKSDIKILWKEDSSIQDPIFRISFVVDIGGIQLSEYDFDNIREIVLEQNGTGIDYVESYNPQLEEKLSFMRKEQSLSLKDEVFSFCALSHIPITEVRDYTLFQFQEHFKRLMLLQEYAMYKPLEASGFIKLKSGEIKHYLSSIKKQKRYDGILLEKNSFMNSSDVFKAVK